MKDQQLTNMTSSEIRVLVAKCRKLLEGTTPGKWRKSLHSSSGELSVIAVTGPFPNDPIKVARRFNTEGDCNFIAESKDVITCVIDLLGELANYKRQDELVR